MENLEVLEELAKLTLREKIIASHARGSRQRKLLDGLVLENHHAAAAFAQIRKKGNDIFAGLEVAKRKPVRDTIIKCVLATDLAEHFDVLGKFKTSLLEGAVARDKTLDFGTRVLIMQVALKCGDVSTRQYETGTPRRQRSCKTLANAR